MTFQATFRDRVVPAATRAFGVVATWIHGPDLVELTLLRGRRDLASRRKSLGADAFITVDMQEFVVSAADLSADLTTFVPQYGDIIEYAGEEGEPIQGCVFPLVAGRCWDYFDATESRLRVYTVDLTDLENVTLRPTAGDPYSVLGIVSTIRGAEAYPDYGQTIKTLSVDVYLPRQAFRERDIESPPLMTTLDVLGLDGWAVNMAGTEWGDGLVKLMVDRDTLAREYQARRHAAV